MTNIVDWQERTALITDAGQGIGRQIALHFAQNNARSAGANPSPDARKTFWETGSAPLGTVLSA